MLRNKNSRNLLPPSLTPHNVKTVSIHLLDSLLLAAIFLNSATPVPFSCYPYNLFLVFHWVFFLLVVLPLSALVPYPLPSVPHIQTISFYLEFSWFIYNFAIPRYISPCLSNYSSIALLCTCYPLPTIIIYCSLFHFS